MWTRLNNFVPIKNKITTWKIICLNFVQAAPSLWTLRFSQFPCCVHIFSSHSFTSYVSPQIGLLTLKDYDLRGSLIAYLLKWRFDPMSDLLDFFIYNSLLFTIDKKVYFLSTLLNPLVIVKE